MSTQLIRFGRQNYVIEDFETLRARNPKYPFNDAMQFCSAHTPDSDICDVMECEDCHLKTGESQ